VVNQSVVEGSLSVLAAVVSVGFVDFFTGVEKGSAVDVRSPL
jgi:hypothetical protein